MSQRWLRLAEFLLLGLCVVFLGFHFLHLRADFPNHSPWIDWAKYTDEGWYGDAAIRYALRGHWRVPGDFNPAAALPVWPLLEAALFEVTGVGVVPARALAVIVFCGIVCLSYLLLRRSAGRLAAAGCALLMSLSPYLYAFGRMAILEPLLILLALTAFMVAGAEVGQGWRRWVCALVAGLLMA